MRLFFLLFSSLIVVIISFGCKKVYPTTEIHNDTTIVIHSDTTIIRDTTVYNNLKQIGYSLPTFNTGDASFIPTEYYSLKKFNIDYFPNADSVFYIANVGLGDVDDVEFELFNITD
ncbi:MAG: hypothetical protein INR73_29170, partial [Williamsia sp.]|nr:hypothetical protein [Williamsia sp.]